MSFCCTLKVQFSLHDEAKIIAVLNIKNAVTVYIYDIIASYISNNVGKYQFQLMMRKMNCFSHYNL